jgi:hypothetical protein
MGDLEIVDFLLSKDWGRRSVPGVKSVELRRQPARRWTPLLSIRNSSQTTNKAYPQAPALLWSVE